MLKFVDNSFGNKPAIDQYPDILDILLVHMCAVSTTAQAHFGEGTKLTVLGKKHISYCLNGNAFNRK